MVVTAACGLSLALVICGGAPAQDQKKAVVSDDESAIRAQAAQFADAFNKGDADAIAKQFTEDARVIDADGRSVEGREAIRKRFAEAIEAGGGAKVEFKTDRVQLVGREVAIEEGHASAKNADGTIAGRGPYTVIYAKQDGQWKIAVVRDHEPAADDAANTPHAHLEELAWMVGEWVDESDEAVVRTSCNWSKDGNYLLREFTVHVAGKPAMSGTQRIGWDAQHEQIRSWVFDSDGGFSQGLWSRSGDNQWRIVSTGTTRDGDTATAVNIVTREHPDTMRWQSIERTLGGESLPDTDDIVIARKPPGPASASAEKSQKK
jgi:uncharacterized protein (TIGR02246 family)